MACGFTTDGEAGTMGTVLQDDMSKRQHDRLAGLGFEQLLTVAETAELSRHPVSYIYRAIYEGQLPAFRHERSWRLKVSDVRAWIESSH